MRHAAPPSDPSPPGEPEEEPSFVIAVIRTGGIAGIPRRWHVEPPRDEEPRWIELIDLCPWDAPGPEQSGADRYVWSIQARTRRARLERELPESALDGPWRQLVDAVRAAAS